MLMVVTSGYRKPAGMYIPHQLCQNTKLFKHTQNNDPSKIFGNKVDNFKHRPRIDTGSRHSRNLSAGIYWKLELDQWQQCYKSSRKIRNDVPYAWWEDGSLCCIRF